MYTGLHAVCVSEFVGLFSLGTSRTLVPSIESPVAAGAHLPVHALRQRCGTTRAESVGRTGRLT